MKTPRSGVFTCSPTTSGNPEACEVRKLILRTKRKAPVKGAFLLVAGVGFEPHDLRVMSPTSYQAALPRDMVPETGFEPARDCSHGILSPGRLPISPFRHCPPCGFRCYFYSIARTAAFVKSFSRFSCFLCDGKRQKAPVILLLRDFATHECRLRV